MFHASWAPGHNSTDYERFYAGSPGEVYQVTGYQSAYEPYVIFKADGPPWFNYSYPGWYDVLISCCAGATNVSSDTVVTRLPACTKCISPGSPFTSWQIISWFTKTTRTKRLSARMRSATEYLLDVNITYFYWIAQVQQKVIQRLQGGNMFEVGWEFPFLQRYWHSVQVSCSVPWKWIAEHYAGI